MALITITEALAEIKVIDKRLAKKRDFIYAHLWRQESRKDPLLGDGGQQVVIERERQSIIDLEQRKVDIRMAINAANEQTEITVAGVTKTIAEWLIWRRDVAPGTQMFLRNLSNNIAQVRREIQQKGLKVVRVTDENPKDDDIHINVNEVNLAADIELIETVLETLDGQLSLKNATTLIEL